MPRQIHEDLNRLPVWVSNRIKRLESDVEYWKSRVAEGLGENWSPVQVEISHEITRSLPHDCNVRFHIETGIIDAKVTDDGTRLRIRLDGGIASGIWIHPVVSNCVDIY